MSFLRPFACRMSKIAYRKNSRNLDTRTFCCNYSKIWITWFYHGENGAKDVHRIANSVDPDQAALLCTVCPDPSVWKLRNIMVNRGTYMSAHVLLNLLKKVEGGGGGEKIKCEALPSILSVFPNKFNKFNNTSTTAKFYLSYDTKIASY